MLVHKPETQTLYAQLLEAAAAHEVELLGGFANGLATERKVRNADYLYWQLRDVTSRLRQVYLGPAKDARARQLRDALVRYKEGRRAIVDDLERIAAAYVASGGARHQGDHFKIVDALARAGVFRAGAVLVGSHAFVSIGAALGVSWTADTIATADVDFGRDRLVSVACDALEPLDAPGVLRRVDPSFFLVPELDLRAPSTSMRSRARGVKVDFLTTAKTPRDHTPRPLALLGIAAQPLRYMDYLVREDVHRALFVGRAPVLVNVPHPGRFALHKLAVAAQRSGGASAIKARKDRAQAAALLVALADLDPGALKHAVAAARASPDKGLVRDIRAELARIPGDARQAVGL
ncbi:MAG TPA: GSU2403 family nucleotidyltransferase fold protein [Labilithrix sp.]|jgi:hypothetical protein